MFNLLLLLICLSCWLYNISNQANKSLKYSLNWRKSQLENKKNYAKSDISRSNSNCIFIYFMKHENKVLTCELFKLYCEFWIHFYKNKVWCMSKRNCLVHTNLNYINLFVRKMKITNYNECLSSMVICFFYWSYWLSFYNNLNSFWVFYLWKNL